MYGSKAVSAMTVVERYFKALLFATLAAAGTYRHCYVVN